MTDTLAATAEIARQNDLFRRSILTTGRCPSLAGQACVTASLAHRANLPQIMEAIATAGDEAFTPDIDPEGGHDFGRVEIDGERIWFKIDYYGDANCAWGSDDPSNPAQTFRLLTVLLPSDW